MKSSEQRSAQILELRGRDISHIASPFPSLLILKTKSYNFSLHFRHCIHYPDQLIKVSASEKLKMAETVFTPALQEIEHVKSENGEIMTKPFLEACKHILPVIDKFGAALIIVKSDIGGNISRLESKYSSDPVKFNFLYSMVELEVETKTAKGSSSCTNGLLWLTRAMDFLLELFRDLIDHPDWSMSQCCNDSYSKTLKKWHGWFASSSVTVAMKLAPDRNKFMEVLGGAGNVKADIEKFLATFSPILQENHQFLASVGMDDLKAS
ncbi:hypothetical protein Nepgr_021770 [Nepenthes gracilis]|uniref:Glycolipid transfer protein domain-containing protein n=1 Tax=Nepenthes gracilis TaxID=150966 RepID=A0AAD3SZ98_NEPGR|nr:hypothetical protein Nepgr_021770 [Nepenthes gracilis]